VIVVEFAGLPGSGKTTLAAHTQAALVARGMPCSIVDAGISAATAPATRAARRVAWAASELGLHPRRGVAAVRAVGATAPGSARDRVAGTVQWLAVQRLVTRSRRVRGVQLMEEGPMQTLWTLGLRSGEDVLTGTLPDLANEGPPDLLVVVDAPVELLSARLGARRSVHSRTQQLPEPERRAELTRGRELLHELVAGASRDHVVVLNDGVRRRSDLGRQVAEWVLRAV
jgi:thymidylate kinase